MRNILVLDSETTGLEPPEDEVIEIGCVLWNIRTRSILESYSALVPRTPPNRGNPAEPFNGISAAVLDEVVSTDRSLVWSIVEDMARRADAVVAHSAAFDRKFVEHARAGEVEHLLRLPWICTLEDVVWPMTPPSSLGQAGSGSLVKLALGHGVAVVSAHRAIHDCLLIVRVLEQVEDVDQRLEEALIRSQRPKDTFVAMVERERNNELKVLGFHWERDKGYWWRHCAVEDAEKFPFEVCFERDYLAQQESTA